MVTMQVHRGEKDDTGNGPARVRGRAGVRGPFPKSGLIRDNAVVVDYIGPGEAAWVQSLGPLPQGP